MQANKLTLERHTGRRPGRTHDGVVIALRSNVRWCSDHFELACRNGEIVRVLFAMMPVIGRSSPGRRPSRHLRRDGPQSGDRLCRTPLWRHQGAHPVEWLSDNGRAYMPRTTPTRHGPGLAAALHARPLPESKGMAEAFVKTFKRAYARLTISPDAATVIALLPLWIEDYCEVHPHSGLKFRSPREFIRLSA